MASFEYKIKLVTRSLLRAIPNAFLYRCFGRFGWKFGWFSQIAFWNNWMETKGAKWPDVFEFRCTEDSELQDYLKELIDVPDGSEVRILDVGSGPLTNLGKQWEGHEVEITAVDPLAKMYDRLLKRHGIVPLVRTEVCDGERLLERFSPNYFDLVYARNCVDHSYDPFMFIKQMLAVTKPGCCVFLDHHAEEGKMGNYRGFHQWNFSVEDEHLIVSNPRQLMDINKELAGLAEVSNELVRARDIHTRIHKK